MKIIVDPVTVIAITGGFGTAFLLAQKTWEKMPSATAFFPCGEKNLGKTVVLVYVCDCDYRRLWNSFSAFLRKRLAKK